MASRHRFLARSITHVSFHNRLTEEEIMWRRHGQEGDKDNNKRYRSRSPSEKQKQYSRKRRSSSSPNNESKKTNDNNQIDDEFGPPLPSNLGINADRWDHAFFMQRYPKEYEKQVNKSKQDEPSRSDDDDGGKKKKKHSKHDRHRRMEEENKKKSKRKHRSRS